MELNEYLNVFLKIIQKTKWLPGKWASVDFQFLLSLALPTRQPDFHQEFVKLSDLYTTAICISKALVLQNSLSTCCTAGESEAETERAKRLLTPDQRATRHTTKPEVHDGNAAACRTQMFPTGTNTSSVVTFLFSLKPLWDYAAFKR